MKSSEKFGLSVALATCYKSSTGSDIPEIDYDKVLSHAKWCLESGCNSITLLGTTAEAASISPAERHHLLQCFSHEGIIGDQLVCGIFATDIDTAVSQIHQAMEFGSRRMLIAPPYYFKPVDDDGVYAWYEAVLARVGTDLPSCLIYNLPSQTGVTISTSLISRLRDRFAECIAGVKDSSGDAASTREFLQQHGDLAILVGDERQLAGAMKDGGQGAICGIANVLPQQMRDVAESAKDDLLVNDLVDEICRYPIISALKFLKSKMENDDSWQSVRPPLSALSEAQQKKLTDWYQKKF
jgi:4-hydroxy-tetrahydrodipicolinate synthase